MASTRAAASMQQVEILEEDLDRAPVDPTTGADSVLDAALVATVRATARRWWFVPVLLAVVIGVGAAQLERADAARSDRIAAIPGMLRPLTDAPRLRWTVPAAADADALVAQDALVLLSPQAGRWQASAYDVRTGEARWTRDLGPAPSAGTEAGAASCLHPSVGEDAVVVCSVVAPVPVVADTLASAAVVPATTIVTMSATDGGLLGSWQVAEEVLSVAPVGADVVVATVDATAYVTVARRDAQTGLVRWSYRSTEVTSSLGPAVVQVTDDLVVLTEATTAVLDVTDGREIFHAPFLAFVIASPIGNTFGTWSLPNGGQVRDRATASVRFSLPELPLDSLVDDGSMPDLLVLDGGRFLPGHDVTSGDELWRAQTTLDPVAIVDRRLVVMGGTDVGVVDARTGAMLWTRSLGGLPAWRPVSDGGLLLVPTTEGDGSASVTAFGLGDGVEAWSLPLPDGVRGVRAEGGHLVLVTSEGVGTLS